MATLTEELEISQLDLETLSIEKESLALEKEQLTSRVAELEHQAASMGALKSHISALEVELGNLKEEREVAAAMAVPNAGSTDAPSGMATPQKPHPGAISSSSPSTSAGTTPSMMSPGDAGIAVLRDHNSQLRSALASLRDAFERAQAELKTR